jgi:hypothetical protein
MSTDDFDPETSALLEALSLDDSLVIMYVKLTGETSNPFAGPHLKFRDKEERDKHLEMRRAEGQYIELVEGENGKCEATIYPPLDIWDLEGEWIELGKPLEDPKLVSPQLGEQWEKFFNKARDINTQLKSLDKTPGRQLIRREDGKLNDYIVLSYDFAKKTSTIRARSHKKEFAKTIGQINKADFSELITLEELGRKQASMIDGDFNFSRKFLVDKAEFVKMDEPNDAVYTDPGRHKDYLDDQLAKRRNYLQFGQSENARILKINALLGTEFSKNETYSVIQSKYDEANKELVKLSPTPDQFLMLKSRAQDAMRDRKTDQFELLNNLVNKMHINKTPAPLKTYETVQKQLIALWDGTDPMVGIDKNPEICAKFLGISVFVTSPIKVKYEFTIDGIKKYIEDQYNKWIVEEAKIEVSGLDDKIKPLLDKMHVNLKSTQLNDLYKHYASGGKDLDLSTQLRDLFSERKKYYATLNTEKGFTKKVGTYHFPYSGLSKINGDPLFYRDYFKFSALEFKVENIDVPELDDLDRYSKWIKELLLSLIMKNLIGLNSMPDETTRYEEIVKAYKSAAASIQSSLAQNLSSNEAKTLMGQIEFQLQQKFNEVITARINRGDKNIILLNNSMIPEIRTPEKLEKWTPEGTYEIERPTWKDKKGETRYFRRNWKKLKQRYNDFKDTFDSIVPLRELSWVVYPPNKEVKINDQRFVFTRTKTAELEIIQSVYQANVIDPIVDFEESITNKLLVLFASKDVSNPPNELVSEVIALDELKKTEFLENSTTVFTDIILATRGGTFTASNMSGNYRERIKSAWEKYRLIPKLWNTTKIESESPDAVRNYCQSIERYFRILKGTLEHLIISHQKLVQTRLKLTNS